MSDELTRGAIALLDVATRSGTIDSYEANPWQGRRAWSDWDSIVAIDTDRQIIRTVLINELAESLKIDNEYHAIAYVREHSDDDSEPTPLYEALCGLEAITHGHMSLLDAAMRVVALREEFGAEDRRLMLSFSHKTD